MKAAYRGRFAPTPSGPLHLGSLLTALASWLDARARRGRWLLRIDDLDESRRRQDAESIILRQLEIHGLTWDETPRRQSAHVAEYVQALAGLDACGRVYACSCSRARLLRDAQEGPDGPVYSGNCRAAPAPGRAASQRFRLDPGSTAFDDLIQGTVKRDHLTEIGDFVVRRSDGIYAYHLACAVDESAQRISNVVRGADLLGSTLCQQTLCAALGLPVPRYAHVPVLLDSTGRKLSKQNRAVALNMEKPGRNIATCLHLLGQPCPPDAERSSVHEQLSFAIDHWDLRQVPGIPSLELGAPPTVHSHSGILSSPRPSASD